MTHLEFKLEDAGTVGIFEGEPPHSDGRHRYIPCRSGSHYVMHRRLSDGKTPRCYYDMGAIRVSFSVRAFIEYGVLELCDFRTASLDA